MQYKFIDLSSIEESLFESEGSPSVLASDEKLVAGINRLPSCKQKNMIKDMMKKLASCKDSRSMEKYQTCPQSFKFISHINSRNPDSKDAGVLSSDVRSRDRKAGLSATGFVCAEGLILKAPALDTPKKHQDLPRPSLDSSFALREMHHGVAKNLKSGASLSSSNDKKSDGLMDCSYKLTPLFYNENPLDY